MRRSRKEQPLAIHNWHIVRTAASIASALLVFVATMLVAYQAAINNAVSDHGEVMLAAYYCPRDGGGVMLRGRIPGLRLGVGLLIF